MDSHVIIYGSISLGFIGLLMSSILIFAHKKLEVKHNKMVRKIEAILPGMNCGACGFPGCASFAEAIVQGDVALTLCAPGGEETTKHIAEIIGAEVPDLRKMIAYIRCQGDTSNSVLKYKYHGILECAQAENLFMAQKECEYSCLGLGSCYRACPFDAIRLTSKMLVKVDPHKCTGCGLCIPVCPRDIIKLIPYREKPSVYQVACMSTATALETRQHCQTGCIGCGLCAKNCPVNSITVKDNLAVIDYDTCIGCNACAKVCPTKAINFIKKSKHHYLHLI